MTGPLLWLDVETTGLNQEKHGIISLSVIADFDGQEVASKTFHMNPVGRLIEDSALAVNGFTREQIAAFPHWNDVKADFLAWLVQTLTRAYIPVPVGGFNHVSFDCRFIREWFAQAGENFGAHRIEEIFKIDEKFDVMLLVKRDTTGRFSKLENRKLTTIAASMGATLDHAHTSDSDVRATRELFYKIEAGEGPKT